MKSVFGKIGVMTIGVLLTVSLTGCGSPEAKKDDTTTKKTESTKNNNSSKDSSASSPNSSSSSDSSSSSSNSSSSGSKSSSSNSSSKKETDSYYNPKDGSSLYEYSDGSKEITDGNGNVGKDKDGDGTLDEISTDGGKTWEKNK